MGATLVGKGEFFDYRNIKFLICLAIEPLPNHQSNSFSLKISSFVHRIGQPNCQPITNQTWEGQNMNRNLSFPNSKLHYMEI